VSFYIKLNWTTTDKFGVIYTYFCRHESDIWLPECRLFVVLSGVSFPVSVYVFMCEYIYIYVYVCTHVYVYA